MMWKILSLICSPCCDLPEGGTPNENFPIHTASCFVNFAAMNIQKAEEKTRGFLFEFKKFAMRGNVIDLAVGVVIGAAFGKIVDSVVKDIIMSPLGALIGRMDFAKLFWALSLQHFNTIEEAEKAGVPVVRYGSFLQNCLVFLITAFAVFLLVKVINRLHHKPDPKEPVTPTTKECPFCVSTISIRAKRCPQCTAELA